MLQYRTDLAAEARGIWQESAGDGAKLEGVRVEEERLRGFSVTRVEILDRRGREALGKPEGIYLTIDLAPYFQDRTGRFADAASALAEALGELLPEEGSIFVAGLGNRAMTPDAVGPVSVEHLLVTRHLKEVLPGFRPVSAAAAGVLGTTGLESAEWVRGLAERAEAEAVIVVDALAARSLQRLCTTVQLADTGIIPGSGVGNARRALNRETMGVPVISIGVPTVVDAATLALDLTGGRAPEALEGRGRGLFVTPKEVDAQIADLGKLIGYGVNLAAQRGLEVEDVAALLQ